MSYVKTITMMDSSFSLRFTIKPWNIQLKIASIIDVYTNIPRGYIAKFWEL